MIIIIYNKQTWNEYNDSQTADENLANGAIISADRLNHMENGISNNDINKVTDNKNGSVTVNGNSIIPADDSKVVHSTVRQLNSTDMNTVLTAGFYRLISGTNGMPNVDTFTLYQVIPLTDDYGNGIQLAYGTNSSILGMRSWNSYIDFTGWVKFADDSKVVHNSGDETIGGTKTFTNPIKGTIDGITYRYSAQGDDLDTSYMNDSVIFAGGEPVAHAPAGTDGKMAVIINHNADVNNGAQSYYDTNTSTLYFRVRNDGSKYSPWIKLADDSKVAHLSGANNFDTVPTYGTNNKPFAINDTGATTARPTGQAVGYQYFDTTLNKPIWYNGSKWVDSTGTTV